MSDVDGNRNEEIGSTLEPLSDGTADESSSRRRKWVRVLLPVSLLVGAVLGGLIIVKTGPSPKRRAPERRPTNVEVVLVETKDTAVTVHAAGTVMPSRQVVLQPRIRGTVVSISDQLEPGGVVKEGDELMKIDPTDYRLALAESEGALAQAKANLALENGQQAVAKTELELALKTTELPDSALALRQPQLDSAKQSIAMAKAKRDRASADLSRTRIRSPFDAVVRARATELGGFVSETTPLASLVGTGTWWIEVAVPVDELRWIAVPGEDDREGALVSIIDKASFPAGKYRIGRVVRLAAELESQGRMAKLLVKVEDPMSLRAENAEEPRLLLGAFVEVDIEGATVPNAVSLPRELVREGNRIWVMEGSGEDAVLRIRNITLAYQGADEVIVASGLKAGDQVVRSDISTPVEGMNLQIRKKAVEQKP